jgi:hypothetical protein
LEPNDPILQVCPLGATLVSSGSLPASIHGSSSVEPFFFGSSSSQAGTTVILARYIRVHLLLDQPISDQLASFCGDQ